MALIERDLRTPSYKSKSDSKNSPEHSLRKPEFNAIMRIGDIRDYIRTIGSFPLMTDAERTTMFRSLNSAIQQGDDVGADQLREELILGNLPLVVHIAKRYRGRGAGLDELIQGGNLGLMRAVKLYDAERGFTFSTYASFWIRNGLGAALEDSNSQIRIPDKPRRLIRNVEYARRVISEQKNGEAPTTGEIAEFLKIKPSDVILADQASAMFLCRSLDESIEPNADKPPLWDIIKDTDQTLPEDEAVTNVFYEGVIKKLNCLPAEVRTIIERKIGKYGDGRVQTWNEISEATGLGKMVVQRMYRDGLSQIRDLMGIATNTV